MRDVDVWVLTLDRNEAELRRLHELLAPSERERAGAFPLSLRKRRYAARQGQVREVLARYAGERPEDLAFAHGDRGKPELARGGPRFSVSDSGDLALVAVADGEVGIDVERVVGRPAARRLLRSGDTLEQFYEAWTAREAAGKAAGGGLFDAPADPGVWRSWRLVPADGYAATLVGDRSVRGVVMRIWGA